MAETSHEHHRKLAWLSFIALGLFLVFLWQRATVFDAPSKDSFGASLVQIGQKGGRPIIAVNFNNGEISEPLAEGAMHIVITDNSATLSDGASLARALTPGKRIFGYKYLSRDAGAEIAAKVRADNGEPLTYSELFPGQFFASNEARVASTFIPTFESEYGTQFLSLDTVTFNRDARYVMIAEDEGVTLTARGITWCGDGVTNGDEECDGGQGIEDGCSDLCVLNNECSDGIDNDGDTLIDAPRIEATIPFDLPIRNNHKVIYSSYVDTMRNTAYMFAMSNRLVSIWEISLAPFERLRTAEIPLHSTSVFSVDLFGDGSIVVHPQTRKAYVSVSNPDGQQFIARVDLSTMIFNVATDLSLLDKGDNNLTTAVLDPDGRYAYFAGFVTGGWHRIVKFDLQTFTRVGHIDMFGGERNTNGFLTSFMAPDGSMAYFGDTQGNLIRVNLSTFAPPSAADILHVTRADGRQNSLQASEVSLAGNDAYVVSVPRFVHASPVQHDSEIYRVNLQNFTLEQTFILPQIEGRIQSLAIDPVNGNLLVGTRSSSLLPDRGKIFELTPHFDRVGTYFMNEVGQDVITTLFVHFIDGVRYIFNTLNYWAPSTLAQYRVSGTDPSCQP